VFSVGSTIPIWQPVQHIFNCHHPLGQNICLFLTDNAFLFFSSLIVMKNQSQTEIKKKLFTTVILINFTKQH